MRWLNNRISKWLLGLLGLLDIGYYDYLCVICETRHLTLEHVEPEYMWSIDRKSVTYAMDRTDRDRQGRTGTDGQGGTGTDREPILPFKCLDVLCAVHGLHWASIRADKRPLSIWTETEIKIEIKKGRKLKGKRGQIKIKYKNRFKFCFSWNHSEQCCAFHSRTAVKKVTGLLNVICIIANCLLHNCKCYHMLLPYLRCRPLQFSYLDSRYFSPRNKI